MSGHEDRLAGLVVLSAVLTGSPTVVVRGVSPTVLARGVGNAVELVDAPTPPSDAAAPASDAPVPACDAAGSGAVVAARDAATAAAELAALSRAAGDGRLRLVWVLWDGPGAAAVHRAAGRAGLEAVASYRHVGAAASPTHLVREGQGHALRWFAASVRPRWGPRSRLASVGNHLPRVGHRFLDGTAVLFRAAGSATLTWPGEEFTGPVADDSDDSDDTDGTDGTRQGGLAVPTAGAPAVLHLGGGATAGRLVLTWADGAGAPTHHTKLAPEHLARGVVAEAKALTILAGSCAVPGTVPTLLGLRHGSTWVALTTSHLPGRPAGTPVVPALRRLTGRVAAESCEVDALVTTWVAELSSATQRRARSMGSARAGARVDPRAVAVASLEDVVLQSVVHRGLELGAASNGLLHGDLWPGNVHLVRAADGAADGVTDGVAGIAVLDWESALVGHPLVDLLTWLVSSSGRGEQVRHRAVATLGGGVTHRRGSPVAQHVRTLLASVGQVLEPPEVEALVLAQMVVIAVEGGPVGGDGGHERAWLDAVRDVWAAWQRTGTSPWSPRREVRR